MTVIEAMALLGGFIMAKTLSAIGLSFLLSCCALHPLPEDVTGIDTYAIVMQIRCEAREAIISEALDYLEYNKVSSIVTKPIRDNPNLFQVNILSNLKEIPPGVQDTLRKYEQASISMEFSLQMTEDNNLGAAGGIFSTFVSGIDQLGLNASDNHSRRNLRNFKITENWFDLVKDKRNVCKDYSHSLPDYNYPIAGQVGMKEVVSTYARLNEQVSFSSAKQDSSNNAFVDDLLFTTTVSGSLVPSESLNTPPIKRSLIIKSASGTLGSDRTDQHELIVALFIPKQANTPKDVTNRITSVAAERQASRRFLFGINPLSSLQDIVPALGR